MKINLWTSGGWELFDSEKKGFAEELKKRNITLGDACSLGDGCSLGDACSLGYRCSLGYGCSLGYRCSLGYGCSLGDACSLGDRCSLGYGCSLGYRCSLGYGCSLGDACSLGYRCSLGYGCSLGDACSLGDRCSLGDGCSLGYACSLGDRCSLGYGCSLGYRCSLGYGCSLGDACSLGDGCSPKNFSELNILLKTGITMNNQEGIFYKCVKPDLTDFYSGKHQYKVGKGSKMKLERNQNIECGEGFHFTSFWGARAFLAQKDGVIISARIKLKDILSVYNKIRVKAYSDVQIVKIKGLN